MLNLDVKSVYYFLYLLQFQTIKSEQLDVMALRMLDVMALRVLYRSSSFQVLEVEKI